MSNLDIAYVNNFRLPDTATGSFRSYSHRWTAEHGIVHAVERLMKGETVEIHICDRERLAGMTIASFSLVVEKSYMQGCDRELRITSNLYGGNCRMCDADPITMAATLGHLIGSRVEQGHASFLQPNPEERKELDEAFALKS